MNHLTECGSGARCRPAGATTATTRLSKSTEASEDRGQLMGMGESWGARRAEGTYSHGNYCGQVGLASVIEAAPP